MYVRRGYTDIAQRLRRIGESRGTLPSNIDVSKALQAHYCNLRGLEQAYLRHLKRPDGKFNIVHGDIDGK